MMNTGRDIALRRFKADRNAKIAVSPVFPSWLSGLKVWTVDLTLGKWRTRRARPPALQSPGVFPPSSDSSRVPSSFSLGTGVPYSLAAYFFKKYGLGVRSIDDCLAVLRKGCLAIREGLAATGGEYLVRPPGSDAAAFTFADIAMAAPLNSIKPGDDKFIRVEAEVRVVRTLSGLAEEFADVLAWRDRLYEKHRPTRADVAAAHAAAGVGAAG